MAIDPITGIIMGATQTAVNAKMNMDAEKKLKEAGKRHSQIVGIANQNLHAQALERTGGTEPLGWLFAGAIGRYEQYYTKAEYLRKIQYRAWMYDIELAGWNKEWGDMQTEIAKHKRALRAQSDTANREKILAEPLENYYMETKHWETWWEAEERKKREAAEHNREFWRTIGWKIIVFPLVVFLIILKLDGRI